jgi:FkbM family methyltransferase
MATRCPKGHVYAFEASPRNAVFLRKNIELNEVQNVTVVETALAECEKVVAFVETFFGAGNHIISPEGVKHAAPNITLRSRSLDSFLENEFSHDKIDFVKMDIEGYEPAALLGARNLIRTFQPQLFVEINSFSLSFAHRFDPISFVEFLFDQFEVSTVGAEGKLSPITDVAKFIYQNMIEHQCVDDILITPTKRTSLDRLQQIIDRSVSQVKLDEAYLLFESMKSKIKERRSLRGRIASLFSPL